MIQEMVARQVSEIIQSGTMELQPDFEAREVAVAIMKLQGVWDRVKWPTVLLEMGLQNVRQHGIFHNARGTAHGPRLLPELLPPIRRTAQATAARMGSHAPTAA